MAQNSDPFFPVEPRLAQRMVIRAASGDGKAVAG